MSAACHAVVFVSDPAFLLPTLVAARQVKQQVVNGEADVFVILVGFSEAQRETASGIVAAEGLEIRHMPDIQLPPSVNFNRTHVPQSSLARFFITDCIPAHYDNILYLDGDIQIVGDIRELIMLRVKEGHVAAANDKYWLGSFGRWMSQSRYLGGLGIRDARNYFNSGVLAFRRDTWADMAPKAFDFFTNNSGVCRYHDQSALNVVFKGRRQILPPAYNFISDYVLIGQSSKDARLIHFTGGLKPWYYFGTPWRHRFAPLYEAMVARYPALAAFSTVKTPVEQDEMQRAHRKRMLMYLLACPPLSAWRRAKYRRYIKRTAFALS